MARIRAEEAELPLFHVETRQFITVSQLNNLVKAKLESQLDPFWVVGEISNLRVPPSGHFYFTLKDDSSQVAAVMFRRQGVKLKFVPENGMEVICLGRVSLYPVRGDLQLYVETLEPRGQGALFLAFEQLKKKLAAEGLFARGRKRPLPFLPAYIGIVTSDKGAALHDMLRILRNRFLDRRIIIRAVKVQGDGAAREIAAAIADLNRVAGVEVIIVGRGGGSLEDLWAFNEETVARAIFASTVPVISAVGHEVDFTIADFVADLRAPTPTAAAEMVLPHRDDLVKRLSSLEDGLLRAIENKMQAARTDWSRLVKRLTDPRRKLRENQQRLDEASLDLVRRFQDRVRRLKERLAADAAHLDALSPLAVLERGYSIAQKLPEETIVTDADAVRIGDRLRIRFFQGKAICRVERKE